jgi:hypothetical protein
MESRFLQENGFLDDNTGKISLADKLEGKTKQYIKMTEEQIIYLATKCYIKRWDFETLKYGDDLYGKEEYAEEVWEYVEEMCKIGGDNFYEKYKEFKLY